MSDHMSKATPLGVLNQRMLHKRNKMIRRQPPFAWYLFLLPTLLGISVFMIYPLAESLRLSFTKGLMSGSLDWRIT